MNRIYINKVKHAGAQMFFMLCSLLLSSCSDWLDVRGENIQKEQDQYETYKGFRDALVGCYMSMGDNSIYGERLTMTDIECLADLWSVGSESQSARRYYISKHDYAKDEPIAAFKSIYGGLFNTITSANVILKNIQEKGSNIPSHQARAIIEGEAYAIRAYCQFDLLRLFGQMPNGGTKTVKLPYSYTTEIGDLPAYYAFSDYVANLEKDIEKAETLLKDNDPIFEQTFSQLNYAGKDIQDDFIYYRQSRLNYWAVRALHARMALYTGKSSEAHSIAMDVINAKGADGNPVVSLSGVNDLSNGYNGLPSECLFYLSKYNLRSYATNLLGSGDGSAQVYYNTYAITADMLSDLYASLPGATASHNRYLSEWNRLAKNTSGKVCPILKKYWYDTNNYPSSGIGNVEALTTKLQIIPMLRLSEVYLIAMETSNSLDEVKQLYDTYMYACAFSLYTPFESLEQARAEVINEYRRELFGEGQMFFTYKRLGEKRILWNSDEMTEDEYIIPLPATEYNPELLKK